MKKFITLKSIIPLYIIPYIFIFIALYFIGLIDKESKITFTSFGSGLGGLIVIIGLYFFYQRLEKQQKQIDIQINQRVDERFNSAINLLGSNETSARTGAIYALHELAIEEEKYRRQIAQILCSHIRSKTNEAEYKETHSKRPSNEIQTTIDLLFKEKGLYTKKFARAAEFPKANLSHACLMGVDFKGAQCQKANFANAQYQKANFCSAQCQWVNFFMAQCQGVNFMFAQCQRVDFWVAQCQGVDFRSAQCQKANFTNALCKGVDFEYAQCQGVDFRSAQCQKANFVMAQCQGANFTNALCQDVNFWVAQCQGANFTNAQLQGVDFQGTECQGINLKDAEYDKQIEFRSIGEINYIAINAIEDAKPYLDNSWYEKMQQIIEENKGKYPELLRIKN